MSHSVVHLRFLVQFLQLIHEQGSSSNKVVCIVPLFGKKRISEKIYKNCLLPGLHPGPTRQQTRGWVDGDSTPGIGHRGCAKY